MFRDPRFAKKKYAIERTNYNNYEKSTFLFPLPPSLKLLFMLVSMTLTVLTIRYTNIFVTFPKS